MHIRRHQFENSRPQSDATQDDVVMDLPPPPMLYNRDRCGEVRHHPKRFPPPPPRRPISPPLPTRGVSHASLPRNFAFSQDNHPILERSRRLERLGRYGVDSQRRPCLDPNQLASRPRPAPPPPPPMYREELFPVQRFCYSSSEPNPYPRDDRFNRDLLNGWNDRESGDRFLDVGNDVRYRDGYYHGRELYEDLDERFGNGVLDRGRCLYNERHSYDCRLDSHMSHPACEFYGRRDNRELGLASDNINGGFTLHSEGIGFERRLIHDINDRRLGPSVNYRVQELCTNRDDVEKRLDYGMNGRVWEHGNRRWGYGMDDQVFDFHMKRDGSKRISDCNVNGRVSEIYRNMDGGSMRGANYHQFGHGCGRRLVFQGNYDNSLKNCVSDGASLQMADARQKGLEGSPSFRLGWSGYSKRETIRSNKKNVQCKSALRRAQLGKPCSHSRSRAHNGQPVPQNFSSRGKAILTTSEPIIESDINSAMGKNNITSEENNSMPGSTLAQSREGTEKNDVSTFASNSESLTAGNVNHVAGNAMGHELSEDMNLEGSGDDVSGKISEIRLLEKREKAEHVDGTILEKENYGNEIINVETCAKNEYQDPQSNSGAKMPNCDVSYAFTDGTTDSDSVLPPEEGIVPERAEVFDDISRIFTPTKRRRCCISVYSAALPNENDNLRATYSSRADNMDDSSRAKTTEVADYAHGASSYVDNGHEDRVTCNQSINIIRISNHNPASAFSTKDSVEYIDRVTSSTSAAITSINHCPCPENADAKESAEVPSFMEGCESVELSMPREITAVSDIRDNKCHLDTHMDRSISMSDLEVHQKADNRVISDMGSENLNTKVFGSAQDTHESGSLRGAAIVDCSSITFCAPSSNVLPDDHKGIPDTFVQSISGTVPPLPFQCSSGFKRKAEDTHISGSDFDSVTDMIETVNGAAITDSTKHLSIALEVDHPVENGSSKEDSTMNESSSCGKDFDIGCVIDLSHGHKKKRKVLVPESTSSLPLEDDSVAEGNSMSECDTIESESTSEFDATYVKEKVSEESVADGSKHHEHDDLDFIANTLSLSGDANDVSTFNSDDELDMDYCPSSPEDLLSHTDFSFSPKHTSASQPKGQIMHQRDKVLEGSTFTNHVEKAPTFYPHNTSQISILEGKPKLPPKMKAVGGNFNLKKNQLISSGPKVFPGHHPPYNSSRKFQPNVTKSRTWHRSDNSSAAVTGVKQQPSIIPQGQTTKFPGAFGSSYIRKGNSLVRNPSQSGLPPAKLHGIGPSLNRSSPSTVNMRKNQASDSKISKYVSLTQLGIERNISSDSTKETLQRGCGQPSNRRTCNLEESVQGSSIHSNGNPALDSSKEPAKASIIAECRTSSLNNSNQTVLDDKNSGNKVIYVRKRRNQLIAASDTEDLTVQQVGSTQRSLSDGYYKKTKNQLIRTSVQNYSKKENESLNANTARHGPPANPVRSFVKRRSYFKTTRLSKFSLVWKLHDTKSSEKLNNLVVPKMVLPHLIPWKRATYRRNLMHALFSRPNKSASSAFSHKILLSRKRGAVYTRSTHGYSLKMSKVLSIGGSSLKWSKSLERNSKKAKEDAARSVAAAANTRKEEKVAPPVVLKNRDNVSRKLFPSVKPRSGERIFRAGSQQYKMDSSRRTLHRITGEAEESSSLLTKTAKNVKKSYISRRLLIGSEEYVRIGNGNQLVRDPKRRTRILASERVRWSLRTARLRLSRKKKYCQFFTRFGKCIKEDGKCPYIHDLSKIAVCTKFLNGTCSNADCKLTHKVIPERMQDCSYFMKGSCSNENCPYRHVIAEPDSAVCESFLRGYCADGNECRKKHTYVCPSFEETGTCRQIATCKLHHPKKKTEKKPLSEQYNNVRGRYFDGGLAQFLDLNTDTAEDLSFKGKDNLILDEGKYPDYISLD